MEGESTMFTTCPNCGFTIHGEQTTLVYECPKCQLDYKSFGYIHSHLQQTKNKLAYLKKLKVRLYKLSSPDHEFLIYATLILIYLVTLFLRFSAEAI